MEIRQMEEKREESKEELTRLQEESAQLDGELKQISREKEQIEEAVKESEKEKHSCRNRSWDGRKNRKSRGRSWSSRTPALKSCIWSLQMPDRKKNLQGRISNVSKKKSEI